MKCPATPRMTTNAAAHLTMVEGLELGAWDREDQRPEGADGQGPAGERAAGAEPWGVGHDASGSMHGAGARPGARGRPWQTRPEEEARVTVMAESARVEAVAWLAHRAGGNWGLSRGGRVAKVGHGSGAGGEAAQRGGQVGFKKEHRRMG